MITKNDGTALRFTSFVAGLEAADDALASDQTLVQVAEAAILADSQQLDSDSWWMAEDGKGDVIAKAMTKAFTMGAVWAYGLPGSSEGQIEELRKVLRHLDEAIDEHDIGIVGEAYGMLLGVVQSIETLTHKPT